MRRLAPLALMLVVALPAQAAGRRWVTGWAAAQQEPDAANRLPAGPTMLQQVVRVTVAGSAVRVRVSNVFGVAPLRVMAVRVARPAGRGSSAIMAGSERAALFDRSAGVTVPAGSDYWSDPVAMPVAAHDRVAISMALVVPETGQTLHTAAHASTYLARPDQLSPPLPAAGGKVERWGFLSGIDVLAEAPRAGIVALGDSITDGSKSTTDGNDRWPDVLSDRLRAAGRAGGGIAVLNLGIGGNRLLADGNGPNALRRFDRDVLGQAGVGTVIVLEGINDIGTLTREGPVTPEVHAALVARIIGAYRQIVARAHRRGLTVYGGTLTPFRGFASYRTDAAGEGDRAAVNRWIRTAGAFDGVIDFDAMLRDPAQPDRLLPAYDSGDHLHPSPAGYRRMGQGIPLTLFAGHDRHDDSSKGERQ